MGWVRGHPGIWSTPYGYGTGGLAPSVTVFSWASPFSMSAPSMLSMSTNMPKALPMKLWFPSIDHVTNAPVGVPVRVSAQVAVDSIGSTNSSFMPTFEGLLRIGIERLERRPEKDQDTRKLMKVVENTEHAIGWSSDLELALDVIGGRPRDHHRDEKNQDTRNTDENSFEH